MNVELAQRKPRIAVIEGKVTTTSLVVAEHFEKNHRDVLRAIRDLVGDAPADFNERNFAFVEYIDAKGETRPMCRMSRDGFSLLAMGFTGKQALQWKIAYIDAFNAMERALSEHAPAAADPEASALDTLSPRQFLQLYYGLDRQMVSAAILWQLMLMGAHREWVTVSLRNLIRGLGMHLSASGVHKAARRLEAEGLIAMGSDLGRTRFFVVAKTVRERIDGALAGACSLPGLPQPFAGALPGKRLLNS
jgi:Rha family phage regulatory protein